MLCLQLLLRGAGLEVGREKRGVGLRARRAGRKGGGAAKQGGRLLQQHAANGRGAHMLRTQRSGERGSGLLCRIQGGRAVAALGADEPRVRHTEGSERALRVCIVHLAALLRGAALPQTRTPSRARL